jgi:DNA-binding Xre family transcriptional regulator
MREPRREPDRRRQVAEIKRQGRSPHGRGLPLPGLWACRVAAGFTQRELAMLVGTSQGTIASLESRDRGAYPRTIKRLCLVLNVEPSDLLCEETPVEEKK